MEMVDRVERLREMAAEGRIVRGEWGDGRKRACLLAALSPEAGREQSAAACPASVMPAWLAHLTPDIDDRTSPEEWPRIVQRYADLAGRWSALSPEAWERARLESLLAIVREARAHVPESESAALATIDEVIGWLERGAPRDDRWRVQTDAWAAWAQARRESGDKSLVAWATWAALQASRAAALDEAAEDAAKDTVRAAENAVRAADAAALAAATPGAWEETKAAAWDRIARAVLDAIEAECVRAEEG